MDIEERLKTLEEEFQATKEELQQILLDIRTYLMEAQTPLPARPKGEKLPDQSDSEKGVESNGNQGSQ